MLYECIICLCLAWPFGAVCRYYTLLGHRDHLLVQGRTLLTDLMVSDDMVKIGNALRDYAGISFLSFFLFSIGRSSQC